MTVLDSRRHLLNTCRHRPAAQILAPASPPSPLAWPVHATAESQVMLLTCNHRNLRAMHSELKFTIPEPIHKHRHLVWFPVGAPQHGIRVQDVVLVPEPRDDQIARNDDVITADSTASHGLTRPGIIPNDELPAIPHLKQVRFPTHHIDMQTRLGTACFLKLLWRVLPRDGACGSERDRQHHTNDPYATHHWTFHTPPIQLPSHLSGTRRSRTSHLNHMGQAPSRARSRSDFSCPATINPVRNPS